MANVESMPYRHAIPVAEGEDVVAVHHEAESGEEPMDRWLVFCHGFLSDRTGSYEERCRRAVREGYHAVRFDFRGCGESDGTFVDQTLSDKIADLLAVVAFFDPDHLSLFGSSFGGKVALHAAPDVDAVAVATRAPVTYNRAFDDARTAVERDGSYTYETGQTIDERFFEDFDRYPFTDAAAALACPVAIVHGTADETVAIADSFEAAATLETDVLLEKLAGEGHHFSQEAERRLRDRVFGWLASVTQ